MFKVFVTMALVSMSLNKENYNFKKNISGSWENNKSGKWIIEQDKENVKFIQQDGEKIFEQKSYLFNGKIKQDGLDDSFLFKGQSEYIYLELNDGDVCRIGFYLDLKGIKYNSKINMNFCMVIKEEICLSNKYDISYFNCSGEWQ